MHGLLHHLLTCDSKIHHRMQNHTIKAVGFWGENKVEAQHSTTDTLKKNRNLVKMIAHFHTGYMIRSA